jgi:iron complex transport system substrate-binding protein
LPRRACLLVLLLAAASLAPARAADIVLQGAGGEAVELTAPAQRIVTLAPHLAESVFAAGAGGSLVATVEYSDHPPEALTVPRIGDAFRLDVERIFALRPDLVIAWQSGNPAAAVGQIRDLGIPVWSVEIREPRAIPELVAGIGRAAGTSAIAGAQAELIRSRLADLKHSYRDAMPLTYFYQVDDRPLFTINGEHLISKGLALCGGVNVFASQSGLAFQTSRESVLLADPAVIFAPSPAANSADPLADWRGWPSLRAVARNALFLLPADEISRPAPRYLDALEQACGILDDQRSRPGPQAAPPGD